MDDRVIHGTAASKANCDASLGRQGGPRCTNCGMLHLTESYCPALDPHSTWHDNPAAQALAARHGAKPQKRPEPVVIAKPALAIEDRSEGDSNDRKARWREKNKEAARAAAREAMRRKREREKAS